jgi:hypothetical protein
MKFDLRTHIRDSKGYVKKANPYRLIIENGVQLFERPPGSGVFFGANGEVIKAPKGYAPDDKVSDKEAAERLAAENAMLKAQLAKVAQDNDLDLPELVKEIAEEVEAPAEKKASNGASDGVILRAKK